ncbi:TPR_REGION domain-containing protein [Haematococcus lacustris]|uniref:TPR_REGION domain-containing protein n=1 Tax=Haematococcus lacustris TaxID=44745 RepID=A0A6A0A3K6_HAELA|nr:TPR_REGION domain-containing protein [Haematococcus lacustris]
MEVAGPQLNLMRCYMELAPWRQAVGNGRQALGDARTARALDPKYPKAWYREGAAHQLLQDWEEAAATFYEGFSLFPANKEFEVAFKQAMEEGRKAHQAAKAAAATAAGNDS